jgi:hypothetical protein
MIIGYSIRIIKEIYISGSHDDLSKMVEIFSAGEGTIICETELSSPPYERMSEKSR